MFKRITLYAFALIGATTLLLWVADFAKQNNVGKSYLKNCANVKVGMTLEQAKEVMGDLDYYNHKYRSEIWTVFDKNTSKVYYLSYPAVIGASTGTEIYFDPNTQIVTKVVCGE